MPSCAQHPKRIATTTIHGRPYCQQCNAAIQTARSRVEPQIQPRDCFVEWAGGDAWLPIADHSGAHWIAHQKSIRRSPSGDTCLAGCVYTASLLVRGLPVVPLDQVRTGNIYISPTQELVGLVSRLEPSDNSIPRIFIRHEQRYAGVKESEFSSDFLGQGSFRR